MEVRVPGADDTPDERLAGLPAIAAAWEYSVQRLTQISQALAEVLPNEGDGPGGLTVFLAGSYGRLESGPPSDADLMVIFTKETRTLDLERLFSKVRETVAGLDIKMSNPRGAFERPFTMGSLVDELHDSEESTHTLTRRMLLLMEARCVYGGAAAGRVFDDLLDHYLQYHRDAPEKELVILLNDTIRYFRQICVDYQWRFAVDKDKWALRNIKLRHSRLLIYVGLLLLILDASREEHADRKRAYLEERLHWPPLVRLSKISEALGENEVLGEVLRRYDRFLSIVNDPNSRQRLQLDYEERGDHELYADLKSSSDEMKTQLADMLYRQRESGVWSRNVFEYLLL